MALSYRGSAQSAHWFLDCVFSQLPQSHLPLFKRTAAHTNTHTQTVRPHRHSVICHPDEAACSPPVVFQLGCLLYGHQRMLKGFTRTSCMKKTNLNIRSEDYSCQIWKVFMSCLQHPDGRSGDPTYQWTINCSECHIIHGDSLKLCWSSKSFVYPCLIHTT